MASVRDEINATLDGINDMLIASNDEDERRRLREQRATYMGLLQQQVKDELDANDADFEAAIEALKAATEAAAEAKKDIEKIAAGIAKAAAAVNAVSKILKPVLGAI